jgi:hypothetical protein
MLEDYQKKRVTSELNSRNPTRNNRMNREDSSFGKINLRTFFNSDDYSGNMFLPRIK